MHLGVHTCMYISRHSRADQMGRTEKSGAAEEPSFALLCVAADQIHHSTRLMGEPCSHAAVQPCSRAAVQPSQPPLHQVIGITTSCGPGYSLGIVARNGVDSGWLEMPNWCARQDELKESVRPRNIMLLHHGFFSLFSSNSCDDMRDFPQRAWAMMQQTTGWVM